MKRQVKGVVNSWYLWIFPVFAVALTGWLVYDFYQQKGVLVKVRFDDANGIQAEKTKVRFRGVAVGTVKDVYLSEDQTDVIAEILLRRDSMDIAVEGSKFSLVIPKVSFQGISGLETVFEGTYISVLPGGRDGKERTDFRAQTNTASTDPMDDTSVYLLEASSVENVNVNDSVTFRGLKIGEVSKVTLTRDSRLVRAQINVENRYSKVIRTNTVFWRKVGVQAKLGLFKSEIKMNSLDSIVNGGIELATPDPAGPMAKPFQKFALYGNPPKDYEQWSPALAFERRMTLK